MEFDLKYLKKRAGMTGDFDDTKVQSALAKIIPPAVSMDFDEAENNGYDCVVRNKLLRTWIDLIPESERGFMGFVYEDGDDTDAAKYIKAAMTKPAWESLRSFVSKDPEDSDLFPMRYLIWHAAVLGRPVGLDFGSYEMNMIFNSLPVDISRNKTRIETPTFAGFYRQFRFAEWGIKNVG
ncbi:MAG: hypothetical protein LBL21_03265 [Rickettsiales bacterium]|jgi:hypothetical protein|nr:hypothetical protein [Rickettsiales bacterium]